MPLPFEGRLGPNSALSPPRQHAPSASIIDALVHVCVVVGGVVVWKEVGGACGASGGVLLR